MSRRRRAEPEALALASEPARGRARAWSNTFIAGFLLLQVFVPLAYYARGGGSDERFAWRFFSSVGLRRCQISIEEILDEGGVVRRRVVDLPSELPSVWIGLLKSERPLVVAKFLRRRCEPVGVRGVVYRRACVDPDGSALPPSEIAWDCALGGPIRSGDAGA